MTAHHVRHHARPATAVPFMPVFGPPQVMFVRGSGTELWDDRRASATSTSCAASPSSRSATPSGGRRRDRRAGAHADARQQPLRQRRRGHGGRGRRSIGLLREATGADGQMFFCNSGAEANEAAIKLARKFGGRGRHVVVSAFGSFHGRTLATLAATGQPAKHEPFHPMPEGFRHVAFGDLDALEASIDPTVAAVLIETVQGEGGVIPATAGYLRGHARAVRRARPADDGRRGPDRVRPHRRVVRVRARRHRPGRGHDGQGAWATGSRSAPCGLAREVAAVFQPGDHGSTYQRHGARHGGRQRRASPRCGASTRRALARDAGRPAPRRPRGAAGCGERPWRRAAARRRARRRAGSTPRRSTAALLARGLVTNAVTGTALRLAPPLTVTDDEIDEAVAIVAAVLA